MYRRTVVFALVASFFLVFTHSLSAAYPTVPSNTWAPANPLALARSGATASLLSDGRVLFAGGFDGSGNPLSSVEIYNADGSVSAGPSMSVARANHSAITLNNGDILVTGGITTAGGSATNSAELFDPALNTWTPVSLMVQPRARHTMSQLPDGSVLIAGGANSNGPVALLEIFSASSNSFAPSATLATARSSHAAAMLADGRVLIIGGTTVGSDGGTQTLASTEIFDPATVTVTAGPTLITARSSHTATTTLNGLVVVIGGSNSSASSGGAAAELASAEIFDPSATTPAFTQSASKLATARTGHLAVLLPHNANVLVIGGTAAGAPLSSVELYTPWNDMFQATGSMASARSSAVGTALMSPAGVGTDGVLLVAGGQNGNGTLSSTEVYGFATVKTDKGDYAPGTVVTITGSGWQPGETVTLSFRESPNIDTPGPYTAVADANGNISDTEFAPDINDLNVRFYLTAVGSSSSLQAQHTFTDSVTTTTSLSCTSYIVQVGQSTTCTAITTAQSALKGTISFDIISPSSTAGTFNPSSCTGSVSSGGSLTCTVSYTPIAIGPQTIQASFAVSNGTGKDPSSFSAALGITVTADLSLDPPNPASVAYGSSGPVALTAHLSSGTSAIPGATLTFTVDGTTVGSASTNTGGTATISFNPSNLTIGSHAVQASFVGGTFSGQTYVAATSNQQTFTVAINPTSTVVTCSPNPDSLNNATTCTATVSDTSSGTKITPTGTVAFSSNGAGTFNNATCTLSSGTCSVTYTPTALGSGTHQITGSYGGDPSHATSNGSFNLTVNNPATTTTVTSSLNPSAYGSPVTFTATVTSASGTPAGTVSFSDGGTCNSPGTTLASGVPVNGSGSAAFSTATLSAASHTVLACYIPSGIYQASSGSLVQTVGQATLTITANSTSKTYGQTVTFAGTEFNTSGLVNSDTVTSVSLTSAGAAATATLTGSPYSIVPSAAAGTGLSNYAVKYVNGTLTVNPAALIITANSTTKTYGQALTFAGTEFKASGLLNGDSVSGVTLTSAGAAAAATVAGSPYNIVPSTPIGIGLGNYTIAYINGALTVNPAALVITAKSLTKNYGNTLAFLGTEFTTAGLVNTDSVASVTLNSLGAAASASVAGSPYAVTPSAAVGTGLSNYTISYVNGSLTVNPATLTLNVTGSGGIYNQQPYLASCSVASGLVNPDTVTLTLSYSSGGAPVNVGNYIATCTSSGNPNYQTATGQASIIITPAQLTIGANSQSMAFGGATPSFTASYSGLQGLDTPAVISGLTLATFTDNTLATPVTNFQTLKAGAYPIVPSGAIAANYVIQYANGILTVNKAALTGSVVVTPGDPQTVAYGHAATATVYLNSYNIGGVNVLQSHPDPANPANILPPSLTVYLVPVGGAPSQAIKFGVGTAVPTYDNTTNTTGTTMTGWAASITANAPPPGQYNAVVYGDDPGDNSLSNLNLADAGYFYTDTADISYPILTSNQLDVVPATLTITANTTSKTYGQLVTFAGTEFTTTGLVNGDTVTGVSLSSAGASAAATVAGSPYSIVPSAAVGTGLTNYTIIYKNGTLTVNPAALTITANSSTKFYGQTVTFAGTEFIPSGLVNGDTVTKVTLTSAGAPATATVSGSPYTIVPSAAVGTGIGNYTINYVAGSLTVNPATLTITANNATKPYGAALPALSVSYSGFVNSDTSTSLSPQPTIVTTATASSPVGSYPITASGAANPNYTISYVAGILKVTQVPLTITASSGTMTFGGVPPVITPSYTGFVNGDAAIKLTPPPTCSTAATSVSTVGTYVSSCSGALDPNYAISYVPGTVTVTQAPLIAGVTVSAPIPAVPTVSFQYSDPVVVTVTFPGTPLGGVSPAQANTQVALSIGTQQVASGVAFTCAGTPSLCTATATVDLVESPNGNGQMSPGGHPVTAIISNLNSNFTLSNAPSTTLTIVQEDAAVGYNGTTYFAVPSTQTTVNIPVSFTLQDATATGSGSPIYDPYPGDITKTATVVISLSGSYINSSGNTSNFNAPSCSVPVSAVLGQVGTNGLPSTATTAPCTFNGVPVNGTYQLTIAPGAGSYYAFPGGYDTSVPISTSNGGGGFITGGGYQTAKYLTSNPSGTGAAPLSLLGPMAAKMNFGYIAKYNKSGSNLQASANIIVRTSCMTAPVIQQLGLSYKPHPGNDGLCAYQIKSNKVISMTDNAYVSACTSTSTACAPGYGVLVVGANIQDVTSANPVSVMGGGTLQLIMYDNSEPGIGNDTLTIQVTDNSGRLWLSNSWTGTKTAIYNGPNTGNPGLYAPVINGGNLQVH